MAEGHLLGVKGILVLGKGTLREERALPTHAVYSPVSPRTAKMLWRYLTTEPFGG